MIYSDVAEELYPHIDKSLADRLLNHYITMKTSQLRGDHEKAGLNAAKFAEIIVAIGLEYIGSEPSGQISFERAHQELLNHPKNSDSDVSLTHLIPTVARTVYTLRNKRGFAHSSEIDPRLMDASSMTACCDWMLSELLRVFHKSEDAQIETMITGLVKRQLPTIQDIDGETLVLKTGLSARIEILAILSHHYPDRIPESKLDNDIPSHNRNNIVTTLRNLEKARMVHKKEGMIVLTEKGLRFVDSEEFRRMLVME